MIDKRFPGVRLPDGIRVANKVHATFGPKFIENQNRFIFEMSSSDLRVSLRESFPDFYRRRSEAAKSSSMVFARLQW